MMRHNLKPEVAAKLCALLPTLKQTTLHRSAPHRIAPRRIATQRSSFKTFSAQPRRASPGLAAQRSAQLRFAPPRSASQRNVLSVTIWLDAPTCTTHAWRAAERVLLSAARDNRRGAATIHPSRRVSVGDVRGEALPTGRRALTRPAAPSREAVHG